MKASELAKKLNELVEKHGDLHVCYEDEGMGGYSHNLIHGKIDVQKTHVTDEGGEAEDIIKRLKLQVQPEENFKVIVLSGTMLMST